MGAFLPGRSRSMVAVQFTPIDARSWRNLPIKFGIGRWAIMAAPELTGMLETHAQIRLSLKRLKIDILLQRHRGL